MKFLFISFAILTTASAALTSVAYGLGYGDCSQSMDVLCCSDQLKNKYGWQTQGDISNFPYIGGSTTISDFSSPQCGQCCGVSYEGKTIHFLAVDLNLDGVEISQAAMDDLTGGQAEQLGRVEAEVECGVDVGLCGL